MVGMLHLLWGWWRDLFRSGEDLRAENLVLRQQLIVLRRTAPRRLRVSRLDRMMFVWLFRRRPQILRAITFLRPETILRWHRQGYRAIWRWKSRAVGRPKIDRALIALIRRMARDNFLWGAPRIHGELLKLGFDVSQAYVAKYMKNVRRGGGGQTWRTFLHNHTDGIASIDLFTVPTITFETLYVFLVLRHRRREIVFVTATGSPTAIWLAQQMREAFPWDSAPAILIRDNDKKFGAAFKRRLHAMGIRDRPTAYRSPWQNGYAERAIGTVRRECLDHLIVANERQLRLTLSRYADYYNGCRTHRALAKDAPIHRAVDRCGAVFAWPILGGLHQRYFRVA